MAESSSATPKILLLQPAAALAGATDASTGALPTWAITRLTLDSGLHIALSFQFVSVGTAIQDISRHILKDSCSSGWQAAVALFRVGTMGSHCALAYVALPQPELRRFKSRFSLERPISMSSRATSSKSRVPSLPTTAPPPYTVIASRTRIRYRLAHRPKSFYNHGLFPTPCESSAINRHKRE
jgi:hypothetical protein